jgi:hypothetical protein
MATHTSLCGPLSYRKRYGCKHNPNGDAEVMARKFHDTYERLAPNFGYITRDDTKVFDPRSKNGRLMIAVCVEILKEYITKEEQY